MSGSTVVTVWGSIAVLHVTVDILFLAGQSSGLVTLTVLVGRAGGTWPDVQRCWCSAGSVMTQPPLPGPPRAHDLPPRWDGLEVEWLGWELLVFSTLVLHDADGYACSGCGSLARPMVNQGWVYPNIRRVGRLGLGRSLVRLFVRRCPDCGLDLVAEPGGEVWELDESDYGDGGSRV